MSFSLARNHKLFLAGGSHPKFSIAATKTITASSTAALLAALKACSGRATKEDATEVNGRLVKAKSLQEGMEIHSQAGCLRDVFVASSLVDMYAKCGSLEKARNVFEAMPWQNVVSWNALMRGYAENGEEEACVNLLSCLVPRLRSPRTYAIALKACNKLAAKEEGQSYGEQELVKIKSLETGMSLHCQAARSGFDTEIFVAGSLIDMYAKCGSLRDARKVFDTIPCYDVVCWNSLMSGYIENGEEGTALALFDCLGSLADSLSYVVAFRACAGLAVEEEAKKGSVKWELLQRGTNLHLDYTKRLGNNGDCKLQVVTSIITMYSKCGSMVEARRVFDGLQRNTHDAVSWTTLMFGYVENKQELQALELFASMAKVCRPNARAFVVALKACTRVAANEGGKVVAGDTIVKVRALENGMEIHSRAATDGFDKNTIVSNAVVEMYAQCGSLVDARAVLDRMVEHDEASWNALLVGYSQSGEQELALELFELLSSSGRSGGRPAYAAALKCCAELAAKEDGRTVDGKLVKLGSLEKVMRIHSQAVKIELDSDRFLASALVDTYAKSGSVLDARRVFDSMVLESQDDLVLWTSIMLAHGDNGEGRVTLELFSRIKSQPWWSPRDPQTMVAALKASGSSEVASLESARRIHSEACRHGLIERDEALASCLVDAYGRLGRSGDSQQVFDSIPVKGPLTWTALVAGYSRVGDPELVFRWFRKMVDEKIIPDAIACVCVLAACSHAGLVDRGREFLREMEAKFGIKPDIRHYSCVVDMLGRANRLEEALAMAETMPVDPNAVTWTTLLGACAKWKNATLGKIAFERSRQMHPSNFQLMANIYA